TDPSQSTCAPTCVADRDKIDDKASVEDRTSARRHWIIKVFRHGEDDEAMADSDALFWDAIPLSQRAAAVWDVSEEVHGLAKAKRSQRRLSRSAFRIRPR